jgi:hypothetical protein
MNNFGARTSIWQVIRLAWALIRVPRYRHHCRIGQIIENSIPVDGSARTKDIFYIENDDLINYLRTIK